MSIMSKVIVTFIVVGCICLASSCEQPARTVLTAEEKQLVDSLYAKQASYARKSADSICDARYEEIFDRATDSLYLLYIKEIEQIRNSEG